MKNLDNRLDNARQELLNALNGDDVNAQNTAFANFSKAIENSIIEQANERLNGLKDVYNDEQILINRGTVKALTTEEKKYFNAVVEKAGFKGVEETFPKTVVIDVFNKLKNEHPILSRVDMVNATAITEYVFSSPNTANGFWGAITDDIKQLILSGFKSVSLSSSKLSGFIPVPKSLIALGADWLAQYVVQLMYEIMATALELAVVQGNGKNQPVGMTKSLKNVLDGVYPDKTAVKLADLTPKSLSGIRGLLAEAKCDVGEVCMLVNPVTYWLKVFPNLAFQTDSGNWVLDKLPTGETVVKSNAVPVDKAVFGVPNNYFLGVSGAVEINEYKETLAIEDCDLYIAKFHGHGIPKDPNAFVVADLSTMTGNVGTKIEMEQIAEKSPVLPS